MLDPEFKIDAKYLLGRDNYKCQNCNEDIGLVTHLAEFKRIDHQSEWINSNVVSLCKNCACLSSKSYQKPLASFRGRLIVITGPMYCEKSTVTRSLFNKYKIGLTKAEWFKPDSDIRSEGFTRTNNGELFSAITISASRPDLRLNELLSYDLIAIDEVQFFSNRIIYVIHKLLERGKVILANGLKLTASRAFFGCMPYLLTEADIIVNLQSVCSVCQSIDAATRTKPFNQNLPSESVGGSEKYYVVCPTCDGGNRELEYVKNYVQTKKLI